MHNGAWEALREVAPLIAAARPCVGRVVQVRSGKRRGVIGTVTWHGTDRFTHAFRYGDEMSRHFTDIAGAHGFRVRVQPNEGEAFFVAAEKVMVCVE